MLIGPTGTGKTMVAKALATNTTGVTLFVVGGATLSQKYVGEGEHTARLLFEMVSDETRIELI